MSNTIQIKRSTTAAAVPTAGQLAVGELAVNLVDKKLYTKDAVGAVVEMGFYNQGNILGTVSESSGVPTGAIIESGSNANGEFVKYADGTMICTGTAASGGSWSSLGTAMFQTLTATWTFPATFASGPTVSGASDSVSVLASASISTATNVTTRAISGVNSVALPRTNYLTAIGRWY